MPYDLRYVQASKEDRSEGLQSVTGHRSTTPATLQMKWLPMH